MSSSRDYISMDPTDSFDEFSVLQSPYPVTQSLKTIPLETIEFNIEWTMVNITQDETLKGL